VPIAVKDIFDTAGVRTTYGSRIFADHVPRADAELVRRAREAGAIVLGKTGTHEFAWGITCVNPHYGTVQNPYAPGHFAGGSSGGSAAALAAFEAPLALGSDTGGSIRIPAAFCGVVGFKPSYGLLPLNGVFPLAPSFDHAGPMARTVEDAALLFAALGGGEVELGDGVAGLTVAVCPDLDAAPLSADVERALGEAADRLREAGAQLVEVPLAGAETIYETFIPIQRAEGLFVHETRGLFPAQAADYGDDVRRRLEQARDASLHDYLGAQEQRRQLGAEFTALLDRVDLLLTPVAAIAAPPLEEDPPRDLILPFTTPQDLLGLPACAVPVDAGPPPLGVQLSGRVGADALVLRAAAAL
jgi:aspartyl-tRNA(Asn)/glutamyl-tRNA(Gln) amidotransferase subunit A